MNRIIQRPNHLTLNDLPKDFKGKQPAIKQMFIDNVNKAIDSNMSLSEAIKTSRKAIAEHEESIEQLIKNLEQATKPSEAIKPIEAIKPLEAFKRVLSDYSEKSTEGINEEKETLVEPLNKAYEPSEIPSLYFN